MSTVRFNLAAVASKSWVAEAWAKIMEDLFGNNEAAVFPQRAEKRETRWEAELIRLQKEVYFLCHHALHQLIPMAGAYQQRLLSIVKDAQTVYDPETAQKVFDEGNRTIENIKGHILGIRCNANKMREANYRVEALQDMHAKAVLYHHSVQPYMDTLKYHMEQLKTILR